MPSFGVRKSMAVSPDRSSVVPSVRLSSRQASSELYRAGDRLCQAFVRGIRHRSWVLWRTSPPPRCARLHNRHESFHEAWTRDCGGEVCYGAGLPHFHSSECESHSSRAKKPSHLWKITRACVPKRPFRTLPQCYFGRRQPLHQLQLTCSRVRLR